MGESILCIGIDGCQSGWIISYRENQNKWKFDVFSTIQSFWSNFSKAKLILIDIPIGLKDKGGEPRLCDRAARKFLTRTRSSSIFPTPCRAALYTDSYHQANEINRKMTGKGLSKQTWNISGKIREVDDLLRNTENARHIFIESHPELCFSALSKGKPMNFYKKTTNGIKERLSVIDNYSKFSKRIFNKVSSQFSIKEVALDDILDAWILGISASRGRSNLNFLPNNYAYDSEGLPMRMAIPKFEKL